MKEEEKAREIGTAARARAKAREKDSKEIVTHAADLVIRQQIAPQHRVSREVKEKANSAARAKAFGRRIGRRIGTKEIGPRRHGIKRKE